MAFKLLICVVKEDETVENLMTGFLEVGLGGATVLQGRGMAEIISEHLPLFAGFRDVFKVGGTSRIVISAVPDDLVEKVFELIENVREQSAEHVGVAFTLPIDQTLGLREQAAETLED